MKKSIYKKLIIMLGVLSLCFTGCASKGNLMDNTSGIVDEENEEYNQLILEAKEDEKNGLLEDALEEYLNAYHYDMTREEAYIGLLNIYENLGNDEQVKYYVEKANEQVKEPNDELYNLIIRCSQLKWWISGGCDEEGNLIWVEYDENGRIVKSNVNFHSFDKMSNYLMSYEFEYLDDGSVKISYNDPEEGLETYWLTYNSDGSIATKRFIHDNGEEREYQYVYQDGEMHEMEGATRWYHTEIEFNSEIGGLIDKYLYSSFDNEVDDNNNLIYRAEYKNKAHMGDDTYNFVGSDTYEWVYCTYEEYVSAKNSSDFSSFPQSKYDLY